MDIENRSLPEANDPAGWSPGELAHSKEWLQELSADDGRELAEAAERGDPPAGLPELSSWIERTGKALKSGIGVSVLRGVPVDRLGEQRSAGLLLEISRALGQVRQQPGRVEIAHVRADSRGAQRRGFRRAGEMPFHADPEDVIGFMCVRPAASGGIRRFASAVTVYNVMRDTCPEQLQVLTEPFHMALQFPHPDHGNRWTRLPFLSVRDGVFNACAYRIHIRQALQFPGVPKLTAAQTGALETFNAVARDVSVSLELRPGDLEYFNNHVVLHTRTQFTDGDAGRHLLRVWLAIAGFRTIDGNHPIALKRRSA